MVSLGPLDQLMTSLSSEFSLYIISLSFLLIFDLKPLLLICCLHYRAATYKTSVSMHAIRLKCIRYLAPTSTHGQVCETCFYCMTRTESSDISVTVSPVCYKKKSFFILVSAYCVLQVYIPRLRPVNRKLAANICCPFFY